MERTLIGREIRYSGEAWRGLPLVSRTLRIARNPRESMPCTSSTKIEPDSRALVVNGDGLADSIVIPRLPTVLPPESKYATSCEIHEGSTVQLGKGRSASWPCPALQAGNYTVTVNINPSGSPGSTYFRVSFGIYAVTLSPSSRRSLRTNREWIDVGVPGSSDAFQVAGDTISVQNGTVLIELDIFGIANHCCFGTSQGNDGAVIPNSVNISLKRL